MFRSTWSLLFNRPDPFPLPDLQNQELLLPTVDDICGILQTMSDWKAPGPDNI